MNKDLKDLLILLRDSAAFLRSKLDDVEELEQADRVMQEVARLESLIRTNHANRL